MRSIEASGGGRSLREPGSVAGCAARGARVCAPTNGVPVRGRVHGHRHQRAEDDTRAPPAAPAPQWVPGVDQVPHQEVCVSTEGGNATIPPLLTTRGRLRALSCIFCCVVLFFGCAVVDGFSVGAQLVFMSCVIVFYVGMFN